jgi:tRNA(Leu) C34 or U34 (ribose-2'-O)-methylase TrmL
MIERSAGTRGYCIVALDNPKYSVNVGSVLRAAWNYKAAGIVISGRRYHKQNSDTMKAHRHIPLFHAVDVMELVPYDCVPVAVDFLADAIPLQEYTHPERAFYVFGAEDATLGHRILSRCRDKIYIPTLGCMNLAACVNVVLYDRMAKYNRVHAEDLRGL